MAYCTVQEVIDRYGEEYVITSCDRDGDGTLDTEALDLALDDATDWMDGFLLGRYALPLVNIPAVFKRFCADIAIFFASEGADTMTNEKRDRFNRAEAWLASVSKGERRLASQGEPVTGGNAAQSATTVTRVDQIDERTFGSRRFTRDKLSGV